MNIGIVQQSARRRLLVTVGAGCVGLFLSASRIHAQPATDAQGASATLSPADKATAIRPFQFTASQEALADLRRRIAAARWPEKETVADDTQGVQLATMQKLAQYWGSD